MLLICGSLTVVGLLLLTGARIVGATGGRLVERFGQYQRLTVAATVFVLSTTIGCAHNNASDVGQGTEQLASTSDSLIQMRRGGCPPRTCPVYSVSIYLDGTVVYDGRANVGTIGRRTARLSAERLNDLLSQIEAMGFMDTSDRCCVCPNAAAGAHRVILDYRPGATYKTVLHDDACSAAPPALSAIERSIDRAAGVEQWTMPLVASKR
jgi:hypothetical protein